MQKTFISKAFLVFLLIAIIYVCYLIFLPFLGELLVATILVTIFYTPYEQLLKLFRGRKVLASAVMCLLVILLVIVPLANFFTYTANRSIDAYNEAETFVRAGGIYEVIEKIENSAVVSRLGFLGFGEERINTLLTGLANETKDWMLSEEGSKSILTGAKNVIAGTFGFIVSIAIVIFSMFFFFMDGRIMVEKIMFWTPLPNKYDKAIFKKFKNVSTSVLLSTFATALAQGLIGAIGFLIIGFPVFFPSITMAFSSIIPYIGTALVWAPIGLYLLVTGNIWQGIFIMIWGAVVVGNSDNVIRAYLIKDKAGVHPLFVVFSILGGLSLFGFWGIVFGPLVISLAVTILHIYEMEYEAVLEK